MPAKSSLRVFAEEILRSVDILESDCASRGIAIPDISDPSLIHSNNDNDFDRNSKNVADAVSSIVTMGMLLTQSVRNPTQSVRIAAASVTRSQRCTKTRSTCRRGASSCQTSASANRRARAASSALTVSARGA